ncbi:MAG: DNA-methyltransferase [Candidatus Neomarinimicrobiota bacterium]
MSIKKKKPLFVDPLEASSGLSIDDLNKYLPVIQKVSDLKMTADKMKDGVFLGLGLNGLKRVPNNTIDLIIATPPESPKHNPHERGGIMTLKEYFEWNEDWLKESFRILKPTGAIYLNCGWGLSGMYHSILNKLFQIQTRITWRDSSLNEKINKETWLNQTSDIWFATKTNEFMFNQEVASSEFDDSNLNRLTENSKTNLWSDIIDVKIGRTVKIEGDKPEQLIERILNASSFKLNWVLDPFTRSGGIGVISKKMGRRFIGFESDKDRLLMALKRIDKEK